MRTKKKINAAKGAFRFDDSGSIKIHQPRLAKSQADGVKGFVISDDGSKTVNQGLLKS